MTATYQDITGWLEEAKRQKATHLIVAVDTFDYGNYPIYVCEHMSVRKEINDRNGQNMQRVDEVYNMSMDIDKQRKERRAWHPEKE